MSDPQVLVTNKANPTGAWIDLVQCCTQENFDAEVISQLNIQYDDTEGFTISDSSDLPKCYIEKGKLHPYAFEFAQMHEQDRTIIFAYSTISTDIANFLYQNALQAYQGVEPDREAFAANHLSMYNIPQYIKDCVDLEKFVKHLEDEYIFVDIASKTYVFTK